MQESTSRFVLRDLPLPSRLVLSLFLCSVGCGYLSALVQLHFQGATPGKPLPGSEEVVATYHGGGPEMSLLEKLLMAEETKPFTGSGSMRTALTTRSSGTWSKQIEKRAKADHSSLHLAEKAIRNERGGEALVLVHWIRSGASQQQYTADEYPIPDMLASLPLTANFVETDEQGHKKAKIKSILDTRCVRCHGESSSSRANQFPLETYEQVRDYCDVATVGGGMSLKKLAQTTHVHLLGFSMLYGLTGLIVTFSSYSLRVRCIIGPLALLAQLVDISCWWLARIDSRFAMVILGTGGVVAISLLLQISLSLFDMYDRRGKKVLVILMLLAAAIVGATKLQVIDPYLLKEGMGAVQTERTTEE